MTSKRLSAFFHVINEIFTIFYKAIELCTATGLNKTTLGLDKFPVDNAFIEIDDGVLLIDDLILAFDDLDLGLGENTKRKKKDTNSQREIFHLS